MYNQLRVMRMITTTTVKQQWGMMKQCYGKAGGWGVAVLRNDDLFWPERRVSFYGSITCVLGGNNYW